MKIEIKVSGNPGLYRDLQESLASASTTHRTWTGAARRLVALDRHAEYWARSMGRWGGWDIIVDGVPLTKEHGEGDCWCEPTPEDARRHYLDPVYYIATELQKRYADIS